MSLSSHAFLYQYTTIFFFNFYSSWKFGMQSIFLLYSLAFALIENFVNISQNNPQNKVGVSIL